MEQFFLRRQGMVHCMNFVVLCALIVLYKWVFIFLH